MVMAADLVVWLLAPQIGQEFMGWKPPTGEDRALGVVGFSMFPHLGLPSCPENTMANAEKWAGRLSVPGYAMDDDTAIQVIDGRVDVISEGHWSCSPARRN
jgi:dipeptidase E